MKKQKNTKSLLFENMGKLNPEFKVNEEIPSYNVNEYKIKAVKLKAVIDDLVRTEDFEVIDTLYRLMVERNTKEQNIQMVAEEVINAFTKNV